MNRRKFIQNSLLAAGLVPVTKLISPNYISNHTDGFNGYWNITPFDRIFGGIKAGSFYKFYPDFSNDSKNSHFQNILLINNFCGSLYKKLNNENISKHIFIRKYSEDFELIMKYLLTRGFTNESLHNLPYEKIIELENEYENSDTFKNQNKYYENLLVKGISIIYIFDYKINNDLCIMPAYPKRCDELDNAIEVEFPYPIKKQNCNNQDNRSNNKILSICLVSDGEIYHFHLLYDIITGEITENNILNL